MSEITSTSGEVKNTTWSILQYRISKDWQGGLGQGRYYPTTIIPRETATFRHVGNENGSQGAVVYNPPGSICKSYDIAMAWYNPPNLPNKAYTKVDHPGSFIPSRWPAICDALIKSGPFSSSTLGGCTSEVHITDGNFPTFSATLLNC